MTKYAALEDHLRETGEDTVSMSFADIEQIIGAELPASAYKHRPWWSNNPSNSVITYSWLKAGYKTANVDMDGQTLNFVKATPYAQPPESGVQVAREAVAAPAADAGFFSRVFGALKGTVTIKPETDLTAPVETDWDAAR